MLKDSTRILWLALPLVVAVLASHPAAGAEASAEWPQFQGPNRDNISTETGLLKRWPEGGKGPSWAHPVVCGRRLYLRHSDFLYCYDIRGKAP